MEKVKLDNRTLARAIVDAAKDLKALDVVTLDLRGISSVADYLVIASGTSNRHVQAIADRTEEALKKTIKKNPQGIEGHHEGRWILLDYGDVVFHVFQEEVRAFYRLEHLWHDAKRVRFLAKRKA